VLALIALLAVAGSAFADRAAQRRTAIVAPPTYMVKAWNPNSDNLVASQGTIEVGGTPVSGVRVRVDSYDVAAPTDAQGRFTYLVDATLLGRHVVTVSDVSTARVGGQPLTKAQQAELLAERAAINVAYAVQDVKVTRDSAGHPVVSGRLVNAAGGPPPVVGLLTYQLTGRVTDSSGKPVAGAQVSTRTQDRDYWTVSTMTDANGRYTSLFTASDETSDDPVPFTVRVSKGDLVYQYLSQEFVYFKRLQSAHLNIRLPPSNYAMALPRPVSYPGAVYTGIAVGATDGNNVVQPVAATWPDASGRFQMTLPARLAGKTISIWEGRLQLFSRLEAKAGGPTDLTQWPSTLPREAPRDLVSVHLTP
jgi:hypothetical protein